MMPATQHSRLIPPALLDAAIARHEVLVAEIRRMSRIIAADARTARDPKRLAEDAKRRKASRLALAYEARLLREWIRERRGTEALALLARVGEVYRALAAQGEPPVGEEAEIADSVAELLAKGVPAPPRAEFGVFASAEAK